MSRAPAFITTHLPVLYSIHGVDGPESVAHVDLAVLVHGLPSFIATHELHASELDAVVASLQRGDVRVAVSSVGTPDGPVQEAPCADVYMVCADGRRFAVAQLRSNLVTESQEEFARRIAEDIASGVQLPDVTDVERI